MMMQKNISLKPFNTFGIDATAKSFAVFQSTDQLIELLPEPGTPLFILGGGSNILFQHDPEGIVLKNEIPGIEKISEDADYVYIKAGAGVNWHQFVMHCIENGYAGIENLALIPGNVGASPMQNIGAYGVEIKDVFDSLEAVEIATGKIINFNNAACKFGYRESIFKNEYKGWFIITSVTYRLNKVPVFNTSYGAIEEEMAKMNVKGISIRSIADAVINIRQSKLPDPAVIGNAGSFFKNPQVSDNIFNDLKLNYPDMPGYALDNNEYKIPAGWMIEQCGWKGYRKGDAGCHAKQALVLVNYGNASGDEIFLLSEMIIASVKEKFGITLQREVNIV